MNEFSEKFIELYNSWEKGEITNKEFIEKSELKPATLFYTIEELKKYKKIEKES